ncbi:MAG: DUF1049 domain-containing protein [Trueperaceae bacterium]|nr:DUF1049 domain-containing protein [Trueperaceae bacterium]
MRLKGILITIIVIISVVFAVTNWQALAANLPINFFFFTIQLPLGLILLGAAVILSAIFFFISLIDRAGQLNRITHLERQIETLQKKLEKKRIDELEGIEKSLSEKMTTLTTNVQGYASKVESLTSQGLAALESKTEAKFTHLEERVLLVRNELAADIAETEDTLKKQFSQKS